jgi:hypothetical protein
MDNPEKLQHRVHKRKKNKTKTQHNMCLTPLYANKGTSPPTNIALCGNRNTTEVFKRNVV